MKLHLGCGALRLEGWENVDGKAAPNVDRVLDLHTELGQLASGAYEWVYTSHVLEHCYPDKLPEILAHLYRALAPGGVLTIATTSLEGIFFNAFAAGYKMEHVVKYLFGDSCSYDTPLMAHRQVFTEPFLTDFLHAAGFATVRPWGIMQYPQIYALNDCAVSNTFVSLLLEGVK